jgi:hypothetical protein
MIYLDKILHSETTNESWPHFLPSVDVPSSRPHTAPCILDPCTISSNISMLLPHSAAAHIWTRGTQMQDVQRGRLAQLGQEGVQWYLDYPLSNAVDGDAETAFRGAGSVLPFDLDSYAWTVNQLLTVPQRRESRRFCVSRAFTLWTQAQ